MEKERAEASKEISAKLQEKNKQTNKNQSSNSKFVNDMDNLPTNSY